MGRALGTAGSVAAREYSDLRVREREMEILKRSQPRMFEVYQLRDATSVATWRNAAPIKEPIAEVLVSHTYRSGSVRVYHTPHLPQKMRSRAKALLHQPASSKSEIVKIADRIIASGLRCILMLAYEVDSHRWYRDR